jgi:mRNA interferase RelE/StbE
MYKPVISKKVVKFVKSKSSKFKHRITNAFHTISKNPFNNNLDIGKYKSLPNVYRLRIGKYRFLYEIKIDDNIIFVYDADSRGDIYK